MDALAKVHNEEICLCDAGLLQSATVLVARSTIGCSSSSRLATPVPLASHPVVPPTACGESGGLNCGHRSSLGTSGTSSGGYERSSTGSKTKEILMLLRCLAASTWSRAANFVTQPSAPTSSATASQSYALGPSSAPSLGTDPWYLDSGASFHMTPHSTHLSTLRASYHHCTVHTTDGSSLSVAG
jgi:hypothetical protein